jgi:hypothetical protein
VLAILGADKDADVVLALVENAATPAATLRVLLDHGKKSVRKAAQSRLVAL